MTAAAWAIVVPLAGAGAAVLGGRRALVPVGLGTAALTLLTAVQTSVAVWRDGPLRHPVGGWGAPLGIDLVADGLSAVMLLMAAGVGAGVSVYAAGYFAEAAHRPAERGFWPLWLFLWASLNAVFLSGDVFNLYVALELLTLSGAGLVVLSRGTATLSAAARYLLAALLASRAYLFGVEILYGAFGALDIETLRTRVAPGWPAAAAFALITSGLLMKTALFPLHFWLPRAHASAVTPASAVLSALVIKASFYITLRLWDTVFAAIATEAAAQLVGLLGAGAVLWGGIHAIRQHRLKLLVAYSTVSQIGYLFLVFPLAFPAEVSTAWRAAAWSGAAYHALSHAFAKSAMFLAAGAMIQAAGQDRVDGLRGVGTRLPLAVFAFGLAGVSIIGLPPSGGFVGKWLLLAAAFESGQWWWAVVIVAGGVLSAGYIFLVLDQALTPRSGEAPAPGWIGHSRVLEQACLWLALAGFVLGLRGTEIVLLVGGGRG